MEVKVRFSTKEYYVLDIPEEIGVEKIGAIISKLSMCRAMHKNMITKAEGNSEEYEIKTRAGNKANYKKFLELSKEDAIQFLKLKYFKGLKEALEWAGDKLNEEFDENLNFTYVLTHLKLIHNIKPRDLGLTKFPKGRFNLSTMTINPLNKIINKERNTRIILGGKHGKRENKE